MKDKFYVCEKCGTRGTSESVIVKGFCHKKKDIHRYRKNIIKKKKVKFKTKNSISVKKFNSYFGTNKKKRGVF